MKYISKGAMLKCSMGSSQSALDVIRPAVSFCGQPLACITDNKPMANIKPFGQCKSLEKPCIPNTPSPWIGGKTDVLVEGNPALIDTSKCLCACAGVIEVSV